MIYGILGAIVLVTAAVSFLVGVFVGRRGAVRDWLDSHGCYLCLEKFREPSNM